VSTAGPARQQGRTAEAHPRPPVNDDRFLQGKGKGVMATFHLRRPAWAALVLLTLPAVSPAQGRTPVRITARADRSEIQLGQSVQVTVEVRGCDNQPEVQPPTVEGCEITSAGPPAARLSVMADVAPLRMPGRRGGKAPAGGIADALASANKQLAAQLQDPDVQSLLNDPALAQQYQQALAQLGTLNRRDYGFTFLATPSRTGSFTLPGFQVTAPGLTGVTPPVSFRVTEAKPQSWVRASLSLSNPRPLVGEEVRLFVDVLVRREQSSFGAKTYPHLPLRGVDVHVPPVDRMPQFELVRPLEKVLEGYAGMPGQHGYRVNGAHEAIFDREPADMPGADPAWYRRRLTIPLRAAQGGKVAIPPLRVSGDVHSGGWHVFVANSDPLTIDIADPRARNDCPRDFSGTVGPLKVTATATPTRVAAGAPVTLTLRLEGETSLPQARGLDLAARPGFAGRFRVRADGDRTVSDRVRDLTFTLRPADPSVKEIPPVELSWYDPKSGRFETARSQAIPLEVTDAPPAAADAPAPAKADEPQPEAGGAEASPYAAALAAAVRWLPWAGMALAGGVAGGGAALAVRRWRRRLAARKSDAGAARQAAAAVRARLAEPGLSAAEVRQLVQEFLRHHFRLPPGEITPRDAAESIERAGLGAGLANACAELLALCAAAEYAPGMVTAAPSELAGQAKQLLAKLVAGGKGRGKEATRCRRACWW